MPLPAAAAASTEQVFHDFDLFGNWAIDCKLLAAGDNPHVAITAASSGGVLEEHDLGGEFAVNRYSVLAASPLSGDRLSIEVMFQPGSANEQRQKLILLIRKGTRRTMFNQPEGGDVRVKAGVALALDVKTPVLRKCE